MQILSKIIVTGAAVFLLATSVHAMSSTNFQIPWDNINTGGSDFSSSTSYQLNDTIGDISGTGTSSNYNLSAGYRAAEIENSISMTVRSQNSGTQSTFSAFSDGASTVTVASAAGFSVGDLIAVVENESFAQLVAVGEITDITGTTITVDDWDGEPGSISASPSGGDDVVYLMSLSTINLGTITSSSENIATTMTSISTDASNGYTVYIQPDQLLQNGSADVITTVTDGAVSLASEEYGTENVGGTALNTGTDLGVTSTQRSVQTSGSSTGGIPDKIAMLYKLAITDATPAGTYTQTIFYTLTANY